jgi:hypothetical protein
MPPFADDPQDAVAALLLQVSDVRAARLRDPQAAEGQETRERVIPWTGGFGGIKQPQDFATVETGGGGVLAHARPADVHGGRAIKDALLDGVAVEARERREATRHRRRRPPTALELARVDLDVSPLGIQRAEIMFLAPGDEVAQIAPVGRPGPL